MAHASLRFVMLETPMLKALDPFVKERSIKGEDVYLAARMHAEADYSGRINSSVLEVAQEIGFGQRKAYEAVKRLRRMDLLRKGRTARGAVFFMTNPEMLYGGKRNKQDAAIELYKTLEGPCKAA